MRSYAGIGYCPYCPTPEWTNYHAVLPWCVPTVALPYRLPHAQTYHHTG
jgi:hypothetical protein